MGLDTGFAGAHFHVPDTVGGDAVAEIARCRRGENRALVLVSFPKHNLDVRGRWDLNGGQLRLFSDLLHRCCSLKALDWTDVGILDGRSAIIHGRF